MTGGFINLNPYSTVDRLLKNLAFLREYWGFLLATALGTRLQVYRGMGIYNLLVKDGLYNGVFDDENYKFVTPSMDKFAKYIKKFSRKIIANYLHKTGDAHQYQHIIMNLRRRIHEPLVNEKIDFLEQVVKISIKEINDMVAVWYTKLVNIIDNWNSEYAEQITNEYFDYDLLIKGLSIFNKYY